MSPFTGFAAFCRREFLEQLRTFRLLIVLAAFLFVGIASPVLAKLTPQLLSALGSDELGGVELLLVKEPDATDALFQYQKNFALLPLLVILLMMGAVSGEKARGTAAMSLVKPVSRTAWLLAKGVVPAVVLLGGTLLAAIITLAYTVVLFGEIDVFGFAAMNGLLLLSLWSWLSIALLGSTLMPGIGASAGFALGTFAVVSLLGSFPSLGRFTPAGLGNAVVDLVLGRDPTHVGTSLAATTVFILLPLALAAWSLRRQEL